ncbi:hypothetical protein Val02_81940 [Virgisporangium aliadipatigenens]|uniref:HNH endonuclease n=1 Tax=Virgisporangium aliadipatigenens TaxID=741659 RepID=A0A8J3YX90_9ACTN|nr:hypothetical protein Val02_81940 [Virgisporangium aliadipatigenens]
MRTPREHRSSRAYRTARTLMFGIYGTVCHWCGHPGATEADHLIPLSVWPDQPIDPHALRPIHGVNGNEGLGCPTCTRRCNQERGASLTKPDLNTSEDW